MKETGKDEEKKTERKYQMVARGRCLEKSKCMPYIVTKRCVQ